MQNAAFMLERHFWIWAYVLHQRAASCLPRLVWRLLCFEPTAEPLLQVHCFSTNPDGYHSCPYLPPASSCFLTPTLRLLHIAFEQELLRIYRTSSGSNQFETTPTMEQIEVPYAIPAKSTLASSKQIRTGRREPPKSPIRLRSTSRHDVIVTMFKPGGRVLSVVWKRLQMQKLQHLASSNKAEKRACPKAAPSLQSANLRPFFEICKFVKRKNKNKSTFSNCKTFTNTHNNTKGAYAFANLHKQQSLYTYTNYYKNVFISWYSVLYRHYTTRFPRFMSYTMMTNPTLLHILNRQTSLLHWVSANYLP